MKNKITGIMVGVFALAASASAAPTAQLQGGQTSVLLAPDFQELLTECQLERIKPGNIKPGGKRLRFPVSSGAVDLDTLMGEAEHRGGFSIACFGGETVVSFQNLRIENIAELPQDPEVEEVEPVTPVITALAAIDGGLQGRLSLFLPGGDEFAISMSGGGQIRMTNAELRLATAAAELLNLTLGTSLLGGEESDLVGTASSRMMVRKDGAKGNGTEKAGEARNKNKSKDDDDLDEEEVEDEEEEESDS